ncbi:MAG: sodium:calcium symporter [Opitutaceae bacterium]|nr:sodium:calcium symporter [Opitutaceae bacterium]
MNPLSDALSAAGYANAWAYLALFFVASLLMIWRLEALLDHGLEGTALGTLVMPYCSGLGNLIFVALTAQRDRGGAEVLTNCLVNNVTNLTLLLGLPALFWGLRLGRGKAGARKKSAARSAATVEQHVSRLSILLTLGAVLVFASITWALAADGMLDASDGLVLVALFLFWQGFQVFDVMKHNLRQRVRFGARFAIDVALVLAGAYGLYVSLDWLVAWLMAQEGGFISAKNLGWLSGWLMVLPNAVIAFFYAARRRADIAYASQVGDGHICIPLCVGLAALLHPIAVPEFFATGLTILAAAALAHAFCLLASDGLPRWMGWPLLAAYAWFLAAGLM